MYEVRRVKSRLVGQAPHLSTREGLGCAAAPQQLRRRRSCCGSQRRVGVVVVRGGIIWIGGVGGVGVVGVVGVVVRFDVICTWRSHWWV